MATAARDAQPHREDDGRPLTIQASVYAGDVSIRYTQAGVGPPLVLLQHETITETYRTFLFEMLSQDFRVVAPALEGVGHPRMKDDGRAQVAFSTWLRSFLDGLGLARASLVATELFGVPALAFSLLDSERVERVALVIEDHPDPAVPVQVAVATFRETETAVFVGCVAAGPVGPESPSAASSTALIRFLLGDSGPTYVGGAP